MNISRLCLPSHVEPLPRGGASLGFNLSYRNGKYEIGYVELDAPDGPFLGQCYERRF